MLKHEDNGAKISSPYIVKKCFTGGRTCEQNVMVNLTTAKLRTSYNFKGKAWDKSKSHARCTVVYFWRTFADKVAKCDQICFMDAQEFGLMTIMFVYFGDEDFSRR